MVSTLEFDSSSLGSIPNTPANGRKTKYKKHFIIINNYFVKLYYMCILIVGVTQIA